MTSIISSISASNFAQRQSIPLQVKNKITQGDLIFPKFEPFFKWMNGKLSKDDTNSYLLLKTSGLILTMAKAVWPLTLPLQLAGLVSNRTEKLAKAIYSSCWSIVYSCYRPWKDNRDVLVDGDQPRIIPNVIKKTYNANEYFRVIVGSLVSAIYGGGAFGMLFAWLRDDDDLYDKAEKVYKTGLLNQNQIFASMNAAVVLRRKFNPNQLPEADRKGDNAKAKIEVIDTVLFLPNIFARTLATFKMFGMNLSEGLNRFVDFLGYFSYGTWAARFGKLKTMEVEGGDLKPNSSEQTDQALHNIQKHSGSVFYTLLPSLSWLASCGELFGLKGFADKVFKLEGICERLMPTIFSWCLRDPWLKAFKVV